MKLLDIKIKYEALFSSGDADPAIKEDLEYIFLKTESLIGKIQQLDKIENHNFSVDFEERAFIAVSLVYIYYMLQRKKGKSHMPTNGIIGCALVIFGSRFEELFSTTCSGISEHSEQATKGSMMLLGSFVKDSVSLKKGKEKSFQGDRFNSLIVFNNQLDRSFIEIINQIVEYLGEKYLKSKLTIFNILAATGVFIVICLIIDFIR